MSDMPTRLRFELRKSNDRVWMMAPKALQGFIVLVVEDYDPVREILVAMLQRIGFHTVYEASNGRQAVEVLQAKTIDLVIADWHMPEMDGLELLKYIRSTERTRTIPFLMVTAEVGEAAMGQVLKADVSSYISKPFTMETLAQKLKEILY